MVKSLSWDEINCEIQPWLKEAVDIMGFATMTPVQASTIPMFSGNKDVVVESVTGSGKTLAFVMPILQNLSGGHISPFKMKRGHFFALIISPTRELSNQIFKVFNSFLTPFPEKEELIKCQLLVGTGASSVRDDLNHFLEYTPQILIGTPGRVQDFLKSSAVKTSSCEYLVLDEADKLLDMNFLKEVENILKLLPKQRRTGLFSATLRSAGNQIFKAGMTNPVKISVNSKSRNPESLHINYTLVPSDIKLDLLIHLLNTTKFKKCIVYLPTCVGVTYIYAFMKYLSKSGVLSDDLNVYSLHGKLQTSSRLKTLDTFSGTVSKSVLLTTDVAARGIDIPEIDFVLQLDPPHDAEVFLHRCGRTGRAEKEGRAIVFLNPGREEDYVRFLEVKNVSLSRVDFDINSLGQVLRKFRDWSLEDRARFEHGVKAYVAFIRYYSKHSAQSIFRLQNFDYIGVAKLYGLVRLPRMPEITKYLGDRTPDDGWLVDSPFDLDAIPYANKQMELARQQKIREAGVAADQKKQKRNQEKRNMAWSNKTAAKEAKAGRKVKMASKRKAIEEKIANEESSDDSDIQEDWKDLVRKNKKCKHSGEVQGAFSDL
ncbi:LAMI_0F12882g1_1 [Lachancea mirantina]|uniref:ATP-dependent RNA helicase n=1 Tax=Lachancea mirantina TaxID=1230905 RepID=A0A1G4K3G3_9SACH|nr:LAMI_0F12882g1_1 [Lachancea mirantina]